MLTKKILTKSQKRRRNEREKIEQKKKFDEKMGPMPVFSEDSVFWSDGNIGPLVDLRQDPWEFAPPHMVDYDECPSISDEAVRALSKESADSRALNTNGNIDELRYLYPEHWGKRGGAKYISGVETEEGRPISERTIQRYFRK